MRGLRVPPRAPERRELRLGKPAGAVWVRLRGPLAVLGLAVLVAVPVWAVGVAWWLDCSGSPARSDMMVVLAGDYSRPFTAAELYKAGLAPTVWVSRPVRDWGQREAVRAGVPFPPEEELDRDILLARGVPAAAIRLYGDGVTSTYAEALAFKAAAHPEGKRVLVVTSRWHARRARMIFRRVLKGSVVRVAGAADPGFSRRWWSDSEMAYAAVLETAKTLWWLAGGRFLPPAR